MTRRLETYERSNRQHGSLALRNDRFPQGRSLLLTGENEGKQVMLCLPLSLLRATELLIR
jgi:hypothetical protein